MSITRALKSTYLVCFILSVQLVCLLTKSAFNNLHDYYARFVRQAHQGAIDRRGQHKINAVSLTPVGLPNG